MPSQQLQTLRKIQKQQIPQYGSTTNLNSKLIDTNLQNLMFGSLQCVQQPQQQQQRQHESFTFNNSHSSLANSALYPSMTSNLNGGIVGGILPVAGASSAAMYGSEQQLCQQYSSQQHSDYIISDYMEKIGTRISMLETELKFAWGALDLLSTEYSKIWSRLEKLENIMVEQQSVVNNLMGLINIKRREQQQLEIENKNEILLNDIFLSTELQTQCPTASVLNEDIDLCGKGKFDDLYEELSKPDTITIRIESELDTLDEFLKEQQRQQQCSENDLQYAAIEKSKSPCFMYSLDEGQLSNRRFGSQSSMSLSVTPPLQPLLIKNCIPSQHKMSDFDEMYSADQQQQQQQQGNHPFLDQPSANNRVRSISRLPTPYNILGSEKDSANAVYSSLFSEATANELDTLTGHTKFFREAASKTGPDVIHMSPEDTGGGRVLKSEMNEDFYKSLNEMYRENNLATEFNHNLDKLLYQSEQQNEQILVGLSNNSTLTSSTLDMIHEDNEDEINSEKHVKSIKSTDDLQLETSEVSKPSAAALSSPNTTSTSASLKRSKVSKKHKKKKHHHKDEMEMINNLKSALAQKSMNFDFSQLSSSSTSKVNLIHLAENTSDFHRSRTASSSSEENFFNLYNTSERLDNITKTILSEINKIGGFSSPSREEINELRKLVISEKIFLEKLNQVNKNLILLLLNPLTMAEELRTVENKGWFKIVMRKLEKNIDTLKKLVGNSFDNYKTQVEAASSLCRLTSSQQQEPKSIATTSPTSAQEKVDEQINHSEAQSELTDYSVQLIRHNSNLDEQLKLLDSQEQEMNKKKQTQQQQQEKEDCAKILGLSNYVDVDASYETLLMQQITDPNLNIYPSTSLCDTSATSISSSNIYSNDAYIKSLKRSLERHNSMLFLLHLQNPDYKDKMQELAGLAEDEDDLILNESANHSPPPPAPDIDFARFNNINHRSNDVMLFLGNKDASNSLNPFVLLDTPKPGTAFSPKQTKSDSGLSSMSGFSTWDRSPNSPTPQIINGSENNPFVFKYQDINVEMMQLLSMTPQKLTAEFTDVELQQPKKHKEYVFSEENLNYIRELSKNLPICSAFENKSMFSIFQHNILDHENSAHTVDDMLAWDQQQQLEKRRMPDLLKTDISRQTFPQHPIDNYQDTNKTSLRSNAQLIDRLVYYPTSRNLTDYNSSQRAADYNLHHHSSGKHLKFQNNTQSEYRPTKAYDSSPTEQYDPHRREHGKQHPKVWQRLGNLLNDNFKLKRPTRYNRSQSLPTGDMETQRSKISMRGQAGSYPSVVTSSKKNLTAKPSTESRQQTNEHLSNTNAIRTKHNKRASFTTTMNNFMQKAKTYRRYSFGLRHGSSLSDPEADLASFTSSDNDESIASDYGIVASNGFDAKEKSCYIPTPMKCFALNSDELEHHNNLNVSESKSKETGNGEVEPNIEQNKSKNFNDQTLHYRSEFEKDLSEELNSTSVNGLFPIIANKTSKKISLDDPEFNTKKLATKEKLSSDDVTILNTPAASAVDNQIPKKPSENQRYLQKVNSLCLNEDRQLLYSEPPHVNVTPTLNIVTPSETSTHKSLLVSGRLALPSAQQSLEIPSLTASSKEDEDNRSQYSYRTLSSSRRQSTEDSIDTDDEYFCYELRQLDELEKQQNEQQFQQQEAAQAFQENSDRNQQLFSQIDQLTAHDIRDDLVDYEPDEKVRANMSNVLQELKDKVKLQPEVPQYRRSSKARVFTDKYTKVTDMHKAWQDVNGDLSCNVPSSIPEPEIESHDHKAIHNNDDEIERSDQDKRLQQQRLQSQETEKPVPQKRYKKRRNMRRLNSTIDDSENPEAQAYSTSSSLSSDDEGKRQHAKTLKSAQLRRNSHERQKAITQKQPVNHSPDSSSIDTKKAILNEIKQIELNNFEDQQNYYSLSSGATSGPDSPTELSGLENDMKAPKSEDDENEIFKTVPNYQGIKTNHDLVSNEKQKIENDETPPPTSTPPIETYSNKNRSHNQDDHIEDRQEHNNQLFQTSKNDDNTSCISNTTQNQLGITNTETQSSCKQGYQSDSPPQSQHQTTGTRKLPKNINEDSSIDMSQTNGSALGSSKWKLLKTLKERKLEERNNQEKIKEDELNKQREKNGSTPGDVGLRGNGHPGDNPFYSNIDSMPDIRPRRKSIPLVSELEINLPT